MAQKTFSKMITADTLISLDDIVNVRLNKWVVIDPIGGNPVPSEVGVYFTNASECKLILTEENFMDFMTDLMIVIDATGLSEG